MTSLGFLMVTNVDDRCTHSSSTDMEWKVTHLDSGIPLGLLRTLLCMTSHICDNSMQSLLSFQEAWASQNSAWRWAPWTLLAL